MIWLIIGTVLASIIISVAVNYLIILKAYEEILNHYEKYLKKQTINSVILKGMLEGRERDGLLKLYEEHQKKITEELEE